MYCRAMAKVLQMSEFFPVWKKLPVVFFMFPRSYSGYGLLLKISAL